MDGRDDGGFGARDPRPDELESNFGDKSIGNWDTEHIIRPPAGMGAVTGLYSKSCTPLADGTIALDDIGVENFRRQVPGWRRVGAAIKQDWKVKDAEAGAELMRRIAAEAEVQGQQPVLAADAPDSVSVELSTQAVGGLTENDFIMACKINGMDFSDLMPKKKMRFWA